MTGRSPSRDGPKVSADSGSRLLYEVAGVKPRGFGRLGSSEPRCARGRGRPLNDLGAGSDASHRRLRPSPQRAHAPPGGRNRSFVARARCQGNGSLPLDVRRPAPSSSCPGIKDGLQRTVRLNRCRRRRLIIRTDCRVARLGPTTPTRARRLADASVDPTEARKATVRRFGRSDRSAQLPDAPRTWTYDA
jgi:hypothetical protein